VNPAGAGAFFSGGGRDPGASLWHLGRRGTVFLAFLGLSVRFAGAPGVTAEPLCVGRSPRNPNLPIVSLAQTLLGAVASVGGFAFPRGSYFWGIALALQRPLAEGPIVYSMEGGGAELAGGTRGLAAFATITATPIAFALFCHTLFSVAGMGLRYLVRGVGPR
jgi:hypothetical protein